MFKNHFGVVCWWCRILILGLLVSALVVHRAEALTYDFDTDGVSWPMTFLPESDFYPMENVWLQNLTRYQEHKIDSGHKTDMVVGLGNSTRLTGNAWYGGFEDKSTFSALSFLFPETSWVDSVAFDFATTADINELHVFFIGTPTDPETDFPFPHTGNRSDVLPLSDSFDVPGGGTGWEGRVMINAADYRLENIWSIDIEPSGLDTPPSELDPVGFAGIDNIEIILRGDGGPDPTDSIVRPIPSGLDLAGTLTGVSHSTVVGPSVLNGTFDVVNDGPDATVYKVLYSGEAFDPGLSDLPNMANIEANEVLSPGAAYALDQTGKSSGVYTGTVTIHNTSSESDPDDDVMITLNLHDRAVLMANNEAVLDLKVEDQVIVSNPAAGPHEGALQASARVESLQAEGAGFSVLEGTLGVGEVVFAGEAADVATVVHNPTGLLDGIHHGTLTASFSARSFDDGEALIDASVDDIEWGLQATVTGSTGGTAQRTAGESMAGLGATSPLGDTTVRILDGAASMDILISMLFEYGDAATPESAVLGTTVDLTIDVVGDAFVLQIGYDDSGLLVEDEAALRLLYFDEAMGKYVNAVLGNSNTDEVGEALYFAGAYAEYLALAALGGVFELGAHGLDMEGNVVWAAIDHNSLFGTGIRVIPEPGTEVLIGLLMIGIFSGRFRSGQISM